MRASPGVGDDVVQREEKALCGLTVILCGEWPYKS